VDLRDDGGEDVVGLLWCTLLLLLLLVQLGPLLYLLLVGRKGPLLLLPLGSLVVGLLIMQLLFDPAQPVELDPLNYLLLDDWHVILLDVNLNEVVVDSFLESVAVTRIVKVPTFWAEGRPKRTCLWVYRPAKSAPAPL
jgi:hypothetical protein